MRLVPFVVAPILVSGCLSDPAASGDRATDPGPRTDEGETGSPTPPGEDGGTAGDGGQAQDSGEIELPSEYEYPDGGGEEDPFDLAAAAQSAQALLAQVRSWNAAPVGEAYEAMMDGATRDCPSANRSDGDEWWIARCTTTEGARFDGYVDIDVFTDHAEGATSWNGTSWYLSAVMESGNGDRFDAAGVARLQSGQGADGDRPYRAWSSAVSGTLRWPGGTGWIAGTATPSVTIQARFYPEDGARSLAVEGEAAVDDPVLAAIAFSGLRFSQDLPGAACALEPEGSIRLRDLDGDWVEVAFDSQDGMDPALCDGCGSVRQGETVLGPLCLDFRPLTDWSTSPW